MRFAVWKDLLLNSPLDVKALGMKADRMRISSHCNITRMTTVALAMFGGMSAGEISGLQWERQFHEDLIPVHA